jgi:hypothetical protein
MFNFPAKSIEVETLETKFNIDSSSGQFHWMANQKKRWVIGVTYGGKGLFTRYYFLDKEKGNLNINELNFAVPKGGKATFGQIATAIKNGQFTNEKFDPDQYTMEKD